MFIFNHVMQNTDNLHKYTLHSMKLYYALKILNTNNYTKISIDTTRETNHRKKHAPTVRPIVSHHHSDYVKDNVAI